MPSELPMGKKPNLAREHSFEWIYALKALLLFGYLAG